jgi:hypothetical protein
MRKPQEATLQQATPALSYYCAGRKCKISTTCHRHTASLEVVEPRCSDYDLWMVQEQQTTCKFLTFQRKSST